MRKVDPGWLCSLSLVVGFLAGVFLTLLLEYRIASVEGKKIISEARVHAKSMIGDAQSRAKAMVDEAERRATEIGEDAEYVYLTSKIAGLRRIEEPRQPVLLQLQYVEGFHLKSGGRGVLTFQNNSTRRVSPNVTITLYDRHGFAWGSFYEGWIVDKLQPGDRHSETYDVRSGVSQEEWPSYYKAIIRK